MTLPQSSIQREVGSGRLVELPPDTGSSHHGDGGRRRDQQRTEHRVHRVRQASSLHLDPVAVIADGDGGILQSWDRLMSAFDRLRLKADSQDTAQSGHSTSGSASQCCSKLSAMPSRSFSQGHIEGTVVGFAPIGAEMLRKSWGVGSFLAKSSKGAACLPCDAPNVKLKLLVLN